MLILKIPRKYKDDLQKASEAVAEGMPKSKAAVTFNVHRGTIQY